MVQNNFIDYETKEVHKEAYIRGWIGNEGIQYVMQYEWKEGEWKGKKTIIERFKAKQAVSRNPR